MIGFVITWVIYDEYSLQTRRHSHVITPSDYFVWQDLSPVYLVKLSHFISLKFFYTS